MRKKINLVLLVIITGKLLLGCSSNISTTLIAFSSIRDGKSERHVYLMEENGSNVRRLVSGFYEEGCPYWSPDGEKILFFARETDNYLTSNVYVVDSDGSNLTKLLEEDFVHSGGASWFHNGERVVLSIGDHPPDLYILSLETGNNELLLHHTITRYYSPSLSPDDSSLVFSANFTSPDPSIRTENPNFDIFLMDLEGMDVIRLTDGPEMDYTNNPPRDESPIWSHDGKWIMYHSYKYLQGEEDYSENYYPTSNIILINPNDFKKIFLTNAKLREENHSASWSPEDNRIVFASNRDHLKNDNLIYRIYDIYIMDIETRELVKIVDKGNNYCPAWQP